MRKKKGKIDFWTLLVVLVLVGIGLVMVLSSSEYVAQRDFGNSFYYLKRQIFNLGFGFAGMFVTTKLIDYRTYKRFATPLLLIGMALLVLVLVSGLGDAAGGSRRWIQLGSVRFQPSDVMKICLIIYMAQSLSSRQTPIVNFVKDFGQYLVILGISCLLIAIMDLGTAIVVGGAVFLLFGVAGVPKRHLLALVALGIAAFVVLVAAEPYRVERLLGFLDPWSDPLDTGYQTIQSLLAIGSGGFMGVGLGSAGSKWYYLPERHTDFIYSVLVEEGGFIFGLVVILLFLFFTWRGLSIAMRARDGFGSLLATGITLMITLQAMVNIAIALGLMPVTGITLPFISYGGTSLAVLLTSVGILLNISKNSYRE